MTREHGARPRRMPGALHVTLFSCSLAAVTLSSVLVVSRTTDYVQQAVVVSADSTSNISLPNGKLLSGTVRNPSGSTVMGAIVQAVSSDGFVAQQTVTGVTGGFQVPLRPGTYRLEVRPPFPDSDDLASFPRLVPANAGTFQVKGDTSAGDVTLPEGHLVTGAVSSTVGTARNMVGWMFATPTDGASPWLVTPAVFGTGTNSRKFTLALPAGKFNLLYAGAQGFTTNWSMVPMSSYGTGKINVTKDMTANVKVGSGTKLSGTVKDSTGKDLNGVLCIKKNGSSPFTDGGSTGMFVMNGKFIGYLPTGTYDATFVPIFDSAYTGRGTKTDLSFTMTAAAKTLSIKATDGVVLSGKITNAKGKVVKTASIAAFPTGADPESLSALPISAKADQKTGAYRLCVPAGTYDIQATPIGFSELTALERLAASLRN
ncbi:MAG: carboxypeptidase regulatory-like domain-containing protein [Acidobacteria bacterium]|nr:carboxypeptidase regulatory-like domain-containing protein [Acidobacteriota bacterium]